jgi:hypothetical protein
MVIPSIIAQTSKTTISYLSSKSNNKSLIFFDFIYEDSPIRVESADPASGRADPPACQWWRQLAGDARATDNKICSWWRPAGVLPLHDIPKLFSGDHEATNAGTWAVTTQTTAHQSPWLVLRILLMSAILLTTLTTEKKEIRNRSYILKIKIAWVQPYNSLMRRLVYNNQLFFFCWWIQSFIEQTQQ